MAKTNIFDELAELTSARAGCVAEQRALEGRIRALASGLVPAEDTEGDEASEPAEPRRRGRRPKSQTAPEVESSPQSDEVVEPPPEVVEPATVEPKDNPFALTDTEQSAMSVFDLMVEKTVYKADDVVKLLNGSVLVEGLDDFAITVTVLKCLNRLMGLGIVKSQGDGQRRTYQRVD